MQRTVAVVAAFAGCTFVGWNMACKLRRRRDALSELMQALERIALDMTHTNRPVAALLHGLGERETGQMFLTLSLRIQQGDTPGEAWAALLACGGVPDALDARDVKTLTVFFSALGTSDRCAQMKLADATLASLCVRRDEAERAYAGKGSVYRTMGLLLGAGAAILLL